MRQVGICQSNEDPSDVVFDVELIDLGAAAVPRYECRGALELELFAPVAERSCRVGFVGSRWFTASHVPLQDLMTDVTAQDCLAELEAQKWWEDPKTTRARTEPAAGEVNAVTTAKALVDLPLVNSAVEQLSDPTYVGVRLKAASVMPVHGSGLSDSFGDDETSKIGELAAVYLWTHHKEFVRWANEHREEQAARARGYVKALNDHPELLDKP